MASRLGFGVHAQFAEVARCKNREGAPDENWAPRIHHEADNPSDTRKPTAKNAKGDKKVTPRVWHALEKSGIGKLPIPSATTCEPSPAIGSVLSLGRDATLLWEGLESSQAPFEPRRR
jgi:hypothetical protein